tara:strand:+ start:113 stop:841 length:729 start_codon:yes stop_codon:yes gene_type:complete
LRSINKYKYLLILLVIIISIIFINFFNNGIVRKELTSSFLEFFSINSIEIIGRERSSKKILSEVLKPYKNKSLVSVNLKNIQNEIEKIVWIKDVIVRKVYPETLSISIEEYSPSAVWKRGSEHYILDKYGYRIEKIKSNEFQNYFKIKGMGADKKLKNLLDKLHYYPDILNQIDYANFISRRRWDLHYKNGLRILLPENNVSESLSLLDSYIKKNKLIEKGHKKIDLRVAGKITMDRVSGNG